MGKIKLEKLLISKDRVDYWFTTTEDLQRFFKSPMHLFMQYDRCIECVPESILVIPFLGNVMQIAWLTDAEVCVDKVDSTFYRSLQRLRDAYQKMYPDCPLSGTLRAECEDNDASATAKSAQMFTGGMDAVTTFIRHADEKPLLILEYGFYQEALVGQGEYSKDAKSDRNFTSDRNAAIEFAQEHGTNTAFIRANYGTFINSRAIDKRFAAKMGDDFWHGLHHAMAILGTAAPVAYVEGIRTLYIASSFSVGNTYPCASDPSTDNEFRFAGTSVIHDGYEMTDQDKARTVVAYQKKINAPLPLRVCSWNDHNCCACEKCLRRMLQINAEGGDPRNFGFAYEHSVLDTTKAYLGKEIQFFTHKNIDKWGHIITRMRDNYNGLFEKEVYNYLKDFDFEKEKKHGLWRYYRKNFFSIVKRKLKGIIRRG